MKLACLGGRAGHVVACALTVALSACGSSGDGGGGPDNDAELIEPDAFVNPECESQILCGQPAVCCDTGDECFEGACVAECVTGIRCGEAGDTCCAEGQVCIGGSCAEPGASCGDSYDCQQPGEFCEPTLGACLPQPDPLTCELTPNFTDTEVFVEASYTAGDIISIPVVADLDGDGDNEVVVNLTRVGGGDYFIGQIVVLDGNDISQPPVLSIPHDPGNGSFGSHGRSTIALGDVSGDGLPDIVYASRPAAANDRVVIVAVDYAGNLLWTSKDAGGADYGIRITNAAITLANFDSDPEAEIVIGATLIDNDGRVLWDQGGDGNGGFVGTNGSYNGGISAVADLDGDMVPEIISGRNAWKVAWNDGPPASATVTPYWTAAGNDGYPAVADFDLDGQPEVVIVASTSVRVVEGQTGLLLCGSDPTGAACAGNDAARTQPIAIPGGTTANIGGPPTVADFDGDGRPEIGIAGGHAYSVYDLNRPGETVVTPSSPPAAGALYIRWSAVTQDQSSNATGSSVFDFQGDGIAEVIYADECFMRVYSGVDGKETLSIANTSATIHEYPLVVDVDRDGNSELLIVANDAGNCGEGHPRRKGLFVYGDPADQWVPTRKVWTQHAYHVTNADSSGNVPSLEADNWDLEGLNNYRQNVQGSGVFNGPDLAVSLSASTIDCGNGNILIRARVENQGDIGVAAGIPVSFYAGTDSSGTPLGTVVTTKPLLPGGSELVDLATPNSSELTDFFAYVDEGEEGGSVAECDELNNQGQTTAASCPVID